jgi:hypothetical protein
MEGLAVRRRLQSSVQATEIVCMRSAFRAARSISAGCAFVLLTACSQGVSPDGPAEDPIDTPSPSDGPAEDPTATPSPSDGWIRYQDPEGHFAVSYPEGWSVEERGPGTIFAPDATQSFPYMAVSALSFTTEPQYGEPPKTQVRQKFEEMGFIPGSRMLDEGPWELDGERAYYGIFVEYAAGFPRAELLIVALVGDRSYYFWLFARPRTFQEFVPIAREMADRLEIQG